MFTALSRSARSSSRFPSTAVRPSRFSLLTLPCLCGLHHLFPPTADLSASIFLLCTYSTPSSRRLRPLLAPTTTTPSVLRRLPSLLARPTLPPSLLSFSIQPRYVPSWLLLLVQRSSALRAMSSKVNGPVIGIDLGELVLFFVCDLLELHADSPLLRRLFPRPGTTNSFVPTFYHSASCLSSPSPLPSLLQVCFRHGGQGSPCD